MAKRRYSDTVVGLYLPIKVILAIKLFVSLPNGKSGRDYSQRQQGAGLPQDENHVASRRCSPSLLMQCSYLLSPLSW